MTAFLIWFLGVVICGLGVSVFIGGVSLHREAFTSLFSEKNLMECFIFSFTAFFLDAVGAGLFYVGYYIMEHNIA